MVLTRSRLYLNLHALLAIVGLAWVLAFANVSAAVASPQVRSRPSQEVSAWSFSPLQAEPFASYPVPSPSQTSTPGTPLLPDGQRTALVSTDLAVATAGGLAVANSAVIGTSIGTALVGAGLVATAPAWIPAAVVGAGIAAIVGGIGLAYYHATHSPANSHYTVIVKPVVVHLPQVFSTTAAFQPVAKSETQLLTATLQINANAHAFWEAQDRAHGAYNARNRTWYERQLKASLSDVNASAKLVGELPDLLAAYQSKLTSSGVTATVTASGKVSAATIDSTITSLHLTATLKKLGLLASLEHDLAKAPAGGATQTVAFPQAVTSPQIGTEFVKSAGVLAEYGAIVREQELKPFPAKH